MKAKFALLSILASTAGLAVHSAHADPGLAGSFNITGYDEPALTSSYTWCFDFTKTGGVLGYPLSGTWNVPAYSFGWTGDWYQVGDEIVIEGIADGTYNFTWTGRLLTPTRLEGRVVEFTSDGLDTSGTFFGGKISGSCPASDGAFKGGDPAK
jgi:hypothetical protein